MMRSILTFFVLIGLLNGVIFPNASSFYYVLKKIKTNACQLPLSDIEEAPDCEKNEEEKTDTKPGQPLEDVILPFDLSIFFFNNSSLSFNSFDSFLTDHFLEIVSPPPKF